MSSSKFGALGAAFTVVRGMEALSLIAIIGMTSNFIQEMVAAGQTPHTVLIGTLSVTCIAVLYVAITYILYYDAQLPFLVALGGDSVLLIAVMVVAITTGKPLSYLNCAALSSTSDASYTGAFISSVGSNMTKDNYFTWVGASKAVCYEMKAIWGLSIALCVLFAFSSVTAGCMWKRQRSERVEIKDIEN